MITIKYAYCDCSARRSASVGGSLRDVAASASAADTFSSTLPRRGPAPPAALFRYSRDGRAEHPVSHLAGYGDILQANAYAGYNALFRADRLPTPLTRALCWAHARRKFFELADVAAQLKRRKGPAVIPPIAAEVLDVTGRKQAEEAHELLAGERSHRVKDLLAIASGLTTITSCATTSAAEKAHDLTARLAAPGRAHDLVRRTTRKEDSSALVGDLIAVLLAPYDDAGAFSNRIRVPSRE